MKVLIVVDMQNDFITGVLGSKEAQAIVPNVANKIREYIDNNNPIFLTQDTHYSDYLQTLEGKNLPIEHCIVNSIGWFICDEIDGLIKTYANKRIIMKSSFGSIQLAEIIYSDYYKKNDNLEIEIVGLLFDICVLSNAILLKNKMPNSTISIPLNCTVASSNEKFNALKSLLKGLQINYE